MRNATETVTAMNGVRTDSSDMPLAIGNSIRPTRRVVQRSQVDLGEIAGFHAQLSELHSRSTSLHQLLGGAMKLIGRRKKVAGSMLIRRSKPVDPGPADLKTGDSATGDLSIASHTLNKSKGEIEKIATWLLPKASESLAKGLPVVATSQEDSLEFLAVPAKGSDFAAIVSVLRWPVSEADRAIELSIILAVARALESGAQHSRLADLARQNRLIAAVLELVQWVQDAKTSDQACLALVSQLKQFTGCDQVFVGLTGGRKTCRLNAASEMPVIDANSEVSLQMKAVLDESIGRRAAGAWPPLPGIATHQLLAHKQLAGRDSLVVSTPLKNRAGDMIGAVALVGPRELASTPDLKQVIAAIGEPIGETIDLVRRNQGSALGRVLRSVVAKRHRARQMIAISLTIMIGVILAFPWPYVIRCQSVAEPVERRYCVAPHDGLLETTFVEPGDVVQSGQRLATLDGREILWELAGVTADQKRAEAKRDKHIADLETPQAVMADLEVQTLKNKKELLEFRQSNLQVTAPIDGVVLSGSLDRRENYPVSKGQVLYEVAPIDRLRVEIGIPSDEIGHVEIGDPVTLYFDGVAGESVTGVIETIRPRAEIREQENVFVAEIRIDNLKESYRPGMRATAKIETEPRRIAWILFHHAAEKIRAKWF